MAEPASLALDDDRRWYRYHHLFVDMLRYRLHQTQPGVLPELHRRASAWFEREGLVTEAVDHALAADLRRNMASAHRCPIAST